MCRPFLLVLATAQGNAVFIDIRFSVFVVAARGSGVPCELSPEKVHASGVHLRNGQSLISRSQCACYFNRTGLDKIERTLGCHQ